MSNSESTVQLSGDDNDDLVNQSIVVDPSQSNVSKNCITANNDVVLLSDNPEGGEKTIDAEPVIEKIEEGKKKRKTSKVWSEFSIITLKDGTKRIQCNHCFAKLAHQSTGSTSHLNRHMFSYTVRLSKISGTRQSVLAYPSIEVEGKMSNLTTYKYDKERIRDIMAKMIMVHEYPFKMVEHEFFICHLKSLNPKFDPISRVTLKNDCMKIYSLEKKKVKALLSGIDRVSLTSDLWTSNQTLGYMSLTAHFLNSDWKLQKRVLNFCYLPPPHTGLMISDAIFSCLSDWGIENKITTITLDNASSNDSAVRNLKDSFLLKGNLFFYGKIFHVRCCAHILNIMVQDGLSVINNFVVKVRDSVKYFKGSPSRLHKFFEIAKQLQLCTTKRLVLDVPTRWNSTYAMLESAMQFREVFPRYQERDPHYQSLPSYEDWEKVAKVMELLEVFNEATNVFSGCEYPTSNLFLPKIWKIKELLLQTCNDEFHLLKDIAFKMKEKFDKYWGECNILMAIASILDPRYKMQLVIFCFPKMYATDYEASRNIEVVKRTLYELYEYYATVQCPVLTPITMEGSSSSGNGGCTHKNKTKSRAEFDSWAQGMDTITPIKSDLDAYLEEGRYICDGAESFDALVWWKANTLKFRILSKVARDILSISVSTVASESTFSAGGRVLDQYRSSLKPETVQALICTSDWLRCDYRLAKMSADMDEDEDGVNDLILV